MFLAVEEDDLRVDHRKVGEDALCHSLHHAFLDRADVLLRYDATDRLVLELHALAARQRLNLERDLRVLSVAARLLLVRVLGRRLCTDGLSVRDPRRVHLEVDAELALDALQVHLDVGIAEAGEDHLAGVRVAFEAEAGVFLDDALERRAHLVEVGLRLRRYGRAGRGARERYRRQLQVRLFRGEGVAGVGVSQLGDCPDVARADLRHLLLVLPCYPVDSADPLGGAPVGVPGLRIGL